MKNMAKRCFGALAVTGLGLVVLVSTCTTNPGGQTDGELAVDVNLSASARTFAVSGGEPVQNTDTAFVDLGGETVTGGTISLDPSAITFTPTAPSKRAALLQAGAIQINVTVWIGALDLGTLTCTTGDEYGPFTVTLDVSGNPTSVQPPSVQLTQNTINLLPQFVVCIEVDVLDVIDATIDIATLTLNLDTATPAGNVAGGGSCQSPGDCQPAGCCTCQNGVCVDSSDQGEIRYDETNFPDCAAGNFQVDPGDIFCRNDADCPVDTQCCTGPEICRSNPCTCR
jgi:hypothetical protein